MAKHFGGIELGKPEENEQKNSAGGSVIDQGNAQSIHEDDVQIVKGEWIVDLDDTGFEQAVEMSSQVPVVIDFWAPWCGPCKQLGPLLEKLTTQAGGAVQLAKVNIDQNPALSQAFQVQSVPSVFVMIQGRPLPLFNGALPQEQLEQVFDQILALAQRQGMTARLNPAGSQQENAQPQVPEQIEQAQQAAADEDFAKARELLQNYLVNNPSETATVEPILANVEFEERLSEYRAAGKNPEDGLRVSDLGSKYPTPEELSEQLWAADQAIKAGRPAEAINRLLAGVAATKGEDREMLRVRLVEFFQLIGSKDPLVVQARSKLATLLY